MSGTFYEQRRSVSQANAERLSRSERWLSRSRLAVATLAAVMLWQGHRAPVAVPVAVFVALVAAHARVRRALHRATAEVDACDAGLARIARNWDDAPTARSRPAAGEESATARDLDLTGERSLLRLLDITSPFGTARLEEWLLGDPAPLASIGARQATVRALCTRPQLLLDAAVAGRAAPALSRAHLQHMLRWGAESHLLRSLPRRMVAGAVLVVMVIAIGLMINGSAAAVQLLLLTAPVNLTLAALARSRLQRSFHGLGDAVQRLESAVDTMRRLSDADDVDGELGELQRRLRADDATSAFGSLYRLLAWNDVRYSPMAHWALNGAVAFDALLIEALGWWGHRHGPRVQEWFRIVGDAEALLALGALSFENPAWTLPTVHDDVNGVHLQASELRHPLLAPSVAVGNDIELRDAGDVVVVSGSNMSGKTTFLRAVGVNVLLANLGGPVAASAMTLRRVRVRTSVRIADDLGGGVSLFLAEVRRLRDIVAASELPGQPPVLFLLDEILHGTNNADRRVTTRDVLARLSAAGALGMVTTHDPEIATGWASSDGEQTQPSARVRQIHFRDALVQGAEGVTMTFDYRAHPGPASTSNARRIWAALMGTPMEKTP